MHPRLEEGTAGEQQKQINFSRQWSSNRAPVSSRLYPTHSPILLDSYNSRWLEWFANNRHVSARSEKVYSIVISFNFLDLFVVSRHFGGILLMKFNSSHERTQHNEPSDESCDVVMPVEFDVERASPRCKRERERMRANSTVMKGRALKQLLLVLAAAFVRAQDPCTLCAGNADPTEPLDVAIESFFGLNCAELRDTLVTSTTDDTGLCAGYQDLAVLYCGCPNRSDNISNFCTLCGDGSLPENPEAIVFDLDTQQESTCSQFLVGAPSLETDNACTQIQDVGYSNCGCPIPEELNTGCNMCGVQGESPSTPDFEIIPFTTCGGIDRFMSTLTADACAAYQDTFASLCGCPSAVPIEEESTEVCRFCGAGNRIANPATAVDFSFVGVPQVPCAFAEAVANEDEPDSCGEYQQEYADICCTETGITDDPSTAPTTDETTKATDQPTFAEPTTPISPAPAVASEPTKSPASPPMDPTDPPANTSGGTRMLRRRVSNIATTFLAVTAFCQVFVDQFEVRAANIVY